MRKIFALATALAMTVGAAGSALAETEFKSCKDQVGAATSADYVRDCLLNSTAGHPPCNDANSCEKIVSEVVRACDQGGGDAELCKKYRDLQAKFTQVASSAQNSHGSGAASH